MGLYMSGTTFQQTKFQRWRRQSLSATMCLLVVIAAACSSKGGNRATTPPGGSASATTASATASPSPASAQITIQGEKFPSNVTVSPGAQVTVVNKDSADHTVTSDTAGLFDTNVEGNGQATFTAPAQPGSYPYHCSYHSSMHGVLVVP
jgi:plastocyanin